jgi:hypothetical protein
LSWPVEASSKNERTYSTLDEMFVEILEISSLAPPYPYEPTSLPITTALGLLQCETMMVC